MKIEGKEEELRRHFRRLERRQRKSKPLSPKAKYWLSMIGIVGGFILCCLFFYMVYMDYSNYMSPSECNTKINQALLEAHSESYWQLLISKNAYVFPLLLIAMGIGWALHGVGFRII